MTTGEDLRRKGYLRNDLSTRRYHRVCSEILNLITELRASAFGFQDALNLPYLSYQFFEEKNPYVVGGLIPAYREKWVSRAEKALNETAQKVPKGLDLLKKDFAKLEWYLQRRAERIKMHAPG